MQNVDIGERVLLDEVLLVGGSQAGPVVFGAPVINRKYVSVTATVIEQAKAAKEVIFKKKRRKGYKRTFGHRQHVTALRINEIVLHPDAQL